VLYSELKVCASKESYSEGEEQTKGQQYKPKIFSILVFMVGMALVEFAQKDLTGSQF